MAQIRSARVRQGSLKESVRKRKRRLLKINISPEMNSVFVCMYHFDDNNSLTLYVGVCMCGCVLATVHYSVAISSHFTTPPNSTLLDVHVHLCSIKITRLVEFTSIYLCK